MQRFLRITSGSAKAFRPTLNASSDPLDHVHVHRLWWQWNAAGFGDRFRTCIVCLGTGQLSSAVQSSSVEPPAAQHTWSGQTQLSDQAIGLTRLG